MTNYQTPPIQRRMERFCGLAFGLWLGLYAFDLGRQQVTTSHPVPYALELHP